MSAAGAGSGHKEMIESYVTASSYSGVCEMLEAYPQMRVGKFAEFPTSDADLPVWLDDLDESEAEVLCQALADNSPEKK